MISDPEVKGEEEDREAGGQVEVEVKLQKVKRRFADGSSARAVRRHAGATKSSSQATRRFSRLPGQTP